MADEFIELILIWAALGPHAQTREWLEKQGLTVMPMKSGLLITGSQRQIEKVFRVSLDNQQPPLRLPVPEELAPHVSSVSWPRPREYHP